MRLHGSLFVDEEGQRPIRGYARDADDQDRLTPVELHVRGDRIVIIPVVIPIVVDVDSSPSAKVPVPVQRSGRLDAADFS